MCSSSPGASTRLWLAADNAAVRGHASWRRSDDGGDSVRTDRERLLAIKRTRGYGTVEIRLDDECVGVHDGERGEDPEPLHPYAQREPVARTPQHRPRK